MIDIPYLALIPFLPLIGFVINGVFGRAFMARDSKMVHYIGCGSVGLSFLLSVWVFINLWSAEGPSPHAHVVLYQWIGIGDLSLNMGFFVDGLTSVMLLVVTGVGFLIHIYSAGYMKGDPGYSRFFAYLNLFVFAMLMLVMGDNLVLLFVGWEGVGLCSYLLIGFWFEGENNAKAGMKAFIVNRIGDLGFLLGMFLLFTLTGTLSIPELNGYAGEAAMGAGPLAGAVGWLLPIAALLLFVGATGKSAQIPLYVWLPDAMAGPTPVSALIHAATMVTAGVFMIVRLGPVFDLVNSAGTVIAVVGAATALFAATIAVSQKDIKKVLAYSTVSQLGFMFIAAGVGAYAAAIFHLVTHAFFKALLFLGAGSVIHGMHHAYPEENQDFHQDLTKMGGLRRAMPKTYWTFLVGSIALAGIPPLAGFWSKDEILHHATHAGGWFLVAGILGFIAAAFTAFYTARLVILAFFGQHQGGEDKLHHVTESPLAMTVPLLILAIFAAIGGLFNWPGDADNTLGAHGIKNFINAPEPRYMAAHAEDAGHDEAVAENHAVAARTEAVAEDEALAAHAEGTAEEAPKSFGVSIVGETVVHHGEWVGWLLSLLIAGGFSWLGVVAYTKYKPRIDAFIAAGPGYKINRTLENKYWVDEFYDAYVVKPLHFLSWMIFAFVDRILIDFLFIDGMGGLFQFVSRQARKLQTGFIRHYAFSLTIGVVVVLGIMFIMVWDLIAKF